MTVVFQEKEGYYKLVDMDKETGMPKKTKATDQPREWKIEQYKAGDRVIVVVVALPASSTPEALTQLQSFPPDQVLDASLKLVLQ